MSENQTAMSDAASEGGSLSERFLKGCALSESAPLEAVPLLESVQKDVQSISLFSPNETIEDVSTKSLSFLAVEHFLAMALVSLPASPGKMNERKKLIHRSLALWSSFVEKLDSLELLSPEQIKEYHGLMQEADESSRSLPPVNRDAKIARFKAKQQMKAEMERLKAIRERRTRCGIPAEDEMDGFDEEGLDRSVSLKELHLHLSEAMENWGQAKQELPMIDMMVKMEEERQHMQKHHSGAPQQSDHRGPPRPSGKPLQVTRITQDATGQIQVKKEEIRSKVFRPGWNLPTMSLEELGEREYKAAMEREERQKHAEENRINEPKRYEDLLRDGMEDNADLADASAKLDRDWDDFKDANPRGSGNKMANRGDKNF